MIDLVTKLWDRGHLLPFISPTTTPIARARFITTRDIRE